MTYTSSYRPFLRPAALLEINSKTKPCTDGSLFATSSFFAVFPSCLVTASVLLFLFFLCLASPLFPLSSSPLSPFSHPSSTLTLYLVKRTPTRVKLAVHSPSLQLVPALSVSWRPLDLCSAFIAVPFLLRSLQSITCKKCVLLPSLPFPRKEYYD